MSAPLMNQLLEEAAQRCAELAAHALAGAEAAGEVVEQAKALGSTTVQEATRLHKEYSEAIEAVKHAHVQADHAAEATGQALQSLSPEALKAGSAANDMLMAVEADAFHLGEQRARAFHELDESAREAESGFHDLAAQVKAFEEHLTERLQETSTHLEKFQVAVLGMGDEIGKAWRGMLKALDDLQHDADSLTKVTAHALDPVLDAGSSVFVKFSNSAISGHNELVAKMRHGYLDESKDDPDPVDTYLSSDFDKVRHALAAFEQAPEPAHAALQSTTATILENGEKVGNELPAAIETLQHAREAVTS